MKTSRNTKTASLVALAALTLGGLTAVPSAAQAAEPSSAVQATAPTSAVQTIDVQSHAPWRILSVRGATNIRSGPGTNHSIVGSLRSNQQITAHWVLGTNNESWWKLSAGRGYVSNVMLVKTGSAKPAPKTQTFYSAASNSANVRSGPGLHYRVVDGIPRGNKVTGTIHGSTGFVRIAPHRYVSRSILSKSKPAPPKTRGLRAEAQWWANKVTGVNVPIDWQTERWTYGSSWPQWHVAKERGFMMNEVKIRHYYSGQKAVNMARGVAVHESIHYLQARERGDATISPMPGRDGIEGYEIEADCATLAIEAYYGKKYSMPTNYVQSCTAAEYKIAKKLLRSQGVL